MKIFSIPMAFFVSFFSHSTQACTMPIIKITITDETADVNVIQVTLMINYVYQNPGGVVSF
ncbi:MAG: hypothetical protein IPK77_09805 [Cellvibrio sp.]|nr:hypothetical protein [Cellvibrio sp.]